MMLEHEERGLLYLFKFRHSAKVKELVTRMMGQRALWQDCGDGWDAQYCRLMANLIALLTRVLRRWLGGKWLPGLPDDAQLMLSG